MAGPTASRKLLRCLCHQNGCEAHRSRKGQSVGMASARLLANRSEQQRSNWWVMIELVPKRSSAMAYLIPAKHFHEIFHAACSWEKRR